MFCNVCGSNVPDNADYCPNCGADLRAFKPMAPAAPEAPVAPEAPAAPEAEAPAPDVAAAMSEQISSEAASPMMMDIPIADAPEEFDPEGGTTVLTAGMTGELNADMNPFQNQGGFDAVETPADQAPAADGFAQDPFQAAQPEPQAPGFDAQPQAPSFDEQPQAPSFDAQPQAPVDAAPAQPEAPAFVDPDSPREHQLQAPADKVVTPAPVTGSSILSDASVQPVGAPQDQAAPAAPAPQAQPAPAPIPQGGAFAQDPYAQQQSYGQPNEYGQPAFGGQPGGYSPAPAPAPAPQAGFGLGSIPDLYKPITPWGYIGYSFLFSLPIAGIILLFIYAFGADKNINVKNYARSVLLMIAILIVIYIIIFIIMMVMGVGLLAAFSD